ncbi:hypothetical protein [Myxococcus sp. AS-1-15]|uniref:hypothetical protein n=1 Tax=Myxococcus sp. AS-1-15 TaxID=2874600 RepID=UPI001CBDB681|nr:hypothetical protein [Myxococcus sp. AS-1-15]MBZ4401944.1 hypothetical protein [Myxococcus sp. AS-1-15]
MEMADFERDVKAGGRGSDVDGIAVNISTLASLSRLDKRHWVEFVKAYSLPIDIRPRDASRDILGKVLSHLEDSADAREKLKRRMVEPRGVEASPALMKAFGILLRDDDESTEKGD